MPALGHFRALGDRLHVAAQVLEQPLHQGEIALEVGGDAVDEVVHLVDQLAVAFLGVEPVHPGLGDAVEQAPGGMAAMGEEAAVPERGAQHRRLELGEQQLRDAARLELAHDLLEEHPDQVDGVGMLLGEPRHAALRDSAAELGEQILLQVLDAGHLQLAVGVDRGERTAL
ncbi:MAG: hypothetical protein RML12_02715 [Xanthomonadales bacterium]|nr:hypothetical protein [Xanthomonadales bacterium]